MDTMGILFLILIAVVIAFMRGLLYFLERREQSDRNNSPGDRGHQH